MAHLLDGKKLAAEIRADLKKTVKIMSRPPRLAVVLVGEDPASVLYVNLKEKAAAEAGIAFEKHAFAETVTEPELLEAIRELNRRDDVDAMIVQLPLPRHLDTDRTIMAMDPKKDADGFHPENLARLATERYAPLPVLVYGIIHLLNMSEQPNEGREALIISNSEVFSAPLATALEARGMRVGRIFDLSDKEYLAERARRAQVIVTAVGVPGTVTGDMVSDGAVLIDVGTTRTADGKVKGDVVSEDFEERDVWLTPVPGGVGPVTVAMLLDRTVEMASDRNIN